jgi:hypothetical protein
MCGRIIQWAGTSDGPSATARRDRVLVPLPSKFMGLKSGCGSAGEGNKNRPRIERIRSSGWSANRGYPETGIWEVSTRVRSKTRSKAAICACERFTPLVDF